MAGYCGYSRSNNAVHAESEGRFPASIGDKLLRLRSGAIKAVMTSAEWHHSSKAFNCVDYYDIALLLAIDGEDDLAGHDAEEIAEGRDLLSRLRAWRPAEKQSARHADCIVEWIEWSGSLRRPCAARKRAQGCEVVIRGQTATITFTDGTTLTKRLGTRGFGVMLSDGRRLI